MVACRNPAAGALHVRDEETLTENTAELGFITDIYYTTMSVFRVTLAAARGDPWPSRMRVEYVLRTKCRARCISAYHLRTLLRDEASPQAIQALFNHYYHLTILHTDPPTWLQKRTAYDNVDTSFQSLVQRRCALFLALAKRMRFEAQGRLDQTVR